MGYLWTCDPCKPHTLQEQEDSQSNVRALVESGGGTFSATVHKKIDILVSSKDAVVARTQRIRKAEKHGIPVVGVAFIHECLAGKAWLDPTPYVLAISKSDPLVTVRESNDRKRKYTAEDNDDEPRIATSTSWQDCYCACHDDDDVPYCSWYEHVA
eukprot:m.59704 g.59704  ORF g.59704 m.59704 type:complete len:156 (-) comp15714_c1_seq5:708-1175(-)